MSAEIIGQNLKPFTGPGDVFKREKNNGVGRKPKQRSKQAKPLPAFQFKPFYWKWHVRLPITFY